MIKVGVIGAGSWGTALAIQLNAVGQDVTVWSIIEEEGAGHQGRRVPLRG